MGVLASAQLVSLLRIGCRKAKIEIYLPMSIHSVFEVEFDV